jgi:very-short-patch-repair endonuclease
VIENYRVDFCVLIRGYNDHDRIYLVVECDGHDWHERTREQASRDKARDRAIQAAGFPVLRFTGSEITKDPIRCATEVFDAAHKEFMRQVKSSLVESDPAWEAEKQEAIKRFEEATSTPDNNNS